MSSSDGGLISIFLVILDASFVILGLVVIAAIAAMVTWVVSHPRRGP